MADYQLELTVDLGRSGGGDAPFLVRLLASPLSELIRATERACRVYELLLIDRPGDIWDYVMVALEAVPPAVTERLPRTDNDARKVNDGDPAALPLIPFPEFDRLFEYWDEDTTDEAATWRRHRDSARMRSFARQAL